jgi:hypothetical protein
MIAIHNEVDMMIRLLALTFISTISFFSNAIEPIHIEIGANYESYSNEELRRRVWQLEKAVAQLQDQVFQLAMRNGTTTPTPTNNNWTCQMQSFGKTHVASGNTRSSALAQVLKKCSDATNAVHCHESDVKCDNE